MLKSRHPSVWQRIVDLLMDIVTLGGYSRNTNRYKRVRDAVETLLGRDTLGVDYRRKEAEPAVEREDRNETEPKTDDELPIEPAPEQHTEPEPTPEPEQGESDLPWDNPEPTKPATPTETEADRAEREKREREEAERREFICTYRSKKGVYSGVINNAVYGREGIERLRGKMADMFVDEILKQYERVRLAICIPELHTIFLFTDRLSDEAALESAWWHENTHQALKDLDIEDKESIGLEILEYFRTNDPVYYNHIIKNYKLEHYAHEAVAYYIQDLIKRYGADGFLKGEFINLHNFENINTLAVAIQNYFKYGREESNNRLKRETKEDAGGGQSVDRVPGEEHDSTIQPGTERAEGGDTKVLEGSGGDWHVGRGGVSGNEQELGRLNDTPLENPAQGDTSAGGENGGEGTRASLGYDVEKKEFTGVPEGVSVIGIHGPDRNGVVRGYLSTQGTELEKLGVEFVETDNKGRIVNGEHAGETWASVYGNKAGKNRVRADYIDNEAYRTALREREVENVIVDSVRDILPSNRKEALRVLSQMAQPFRNPDQAVDIYVSNGDAKHSMSFRNIDQIKAIGVIDKIINNAVKIGEVPVSANEIDTTKAVHIFYCPINIDGKQYSARMVVKEYYQGNHVVDELHLYNNQLREERTGQTPAQPQGSPKVLSPILSGYKVKDLIHSTQEADKKLLGK